MSMMLCAGATRASPEVCNGKMCLNMRVLLWVQRSQTSLREHSCAGVAASSTEGVTLPVKGVANVCSMHILLDAKQAVPTHCGQRADNQPLAAQGPLWPANRARCTEANQVLLQRLTSLSTKCTTAAERTSGAGEGCWYYAEFAVSVHACDHMHMWQQMCAATALGSSSCGAARVSQG